MVPPDNQEPQVSKEEVVVEAEEGVLEHKMTVMLTHLLVVLREIREEAAEDPVVQVVLVIPVMVLQELRETQPAQVVPVVQGAPVIQVFPG